MKIDKLFMTMFLLPLLLMSIIYSSVAVGNNEVTETNESFDIGCLYGMKLLNDELKRRPVKGVSTLSGNLSKSDNSICKVVEGIDFSGKQQKYVVMWVMLKIEDEYKPLSAIINLLEGKAQTVLLLP